jgi:hypothetical protein
MVWPNGVMGKTMFRSSASAQVRFDRDKSADEPGKFNLEISRG